jgi:hypothetical protein
MAETRLPGLYVKSGSIPTTALSGGVVSSSQQIIQSLPVGTVSSSTQVSTLLPDGTISSSAQINIVLDLDSVVSSSGQVKDLLPGGTVSSSIQIDYNSIQNKLSDVVSSSTQVQPLLPNDTVSSSAQYPGWVTASSQIDYNSIQNKLSDVVSSSTQVQPLLPNGTVSSSIQYPGWVTASSQVDITATTGYNTFSSSIATKNNTQDISINALNEVTSSYAINSTIQSQLAGVASSSTQVKEYLPSGTVSSSAQYPGLVTASSQIQLSDISGTFFAPLEYTFTSNVNIINSLTVGDTVDDKLNVTGSINVFGGMISGNLVLPVDTVSSSTQVKSFLPNDTVSSSTQYPGWVTASSQIDYNSIQNKLSDVVSSSTQVKPLLPEGSVSSSTQYPGWVTASSQVDYNQIQNKLSGVLSSSTQIQPLLPDGTVSSSVQVDYNSITNKLSGVVSSSTQIQPLLPNGTISSSAQYPGWITASSQIDYNSIQNKLSGVVSSSTQIQPLLPDGTVSSSAQYPGLVTASGQIDYNQIQNKLSGVVSSSTQIKSLLPDGTITSSAQYPGWVTASSQVDITSTTGYSTLSSSIATKNDTQDISINALNAATSSYAINATIQSQLTGVASSSTQIKSLLPEGTVSASTQYPGWVTASSQIDYNSIINKLSDVVSSSTQIIPLLPNGTVSSSTQAMAWEVLSSSYAVTASYVLGAASDWNTLTNKPADLVSSSTQVKTLLPNDTISSSAQYPGWVTASSQIDYNNIQNKLSGTVSSSTQVQSLLPDGTVSSSVQVDYNNIQNKLSGTVSSSTQVQFLLPIGTVSSSLQYPGWITASSQVDYNLIQNKLNGVVSASDQIQSLLPSGTVSSSAQYPGWVTASSQIDYNSIQNKLSDVVSSSTQIQPLLPTGTVSSSTQYPGWVTASSQIDVRNTIGIETLTTTGSNIFTANQTITGSLFISQNLTVLGSSSISYVSQSTLNVGTNKITVNVDSPAVRFGGLDVIDSGSSPQRSGSIYFDSLNDQWIFVHANTTGGVTSSVILMGPATFDNIGNETLLTQNRILKGTGLEHVTDSQITDNGITVSITNGLSIGTNLTASNATITGLTANQVVFTDANDALVSVATTGTGDVVRAASPTLTGTLTAANITATGTMLLAGIISQSSQVDYNNITNKLSGVVSSSTQVQPLLPGGTVSSSNQVSITSTTDYSTFSASIATKNNTQDISINALNAATSSYAINSTIQSQLANVVSSSTQVKEYLPTGTISSSAQYPGWVTASSQIDYNNITNKLSGVVSSSTQVKTLLPDGTVSSSLQIREGSFTGSFTGSILANNGLVSSSTQVKTLLPDGTVSSSLQIREGSFTGSFTGSILADNGIVSSSTQVKTLLPDGTVSSSLQIREGSFTGSFTGSILANNGLVSSSTQVKTLLPEGTVSSSLQIREGSFTGSFTGSILANNGVVSSSTASSPSQGTVRVTINGVNTDVDTGLQTGDSPTFAGLTSTGTVLLAGIYSSSGQVTISSTTGYSTFSSSIATKNDTQDISINALNAATSSYAINSTIQSQLAGVASSSAQVKVYLPNGTVSASAQYPGWVTASSQIDYNSITNKLSGVYSSSTQAIAAIAGQSIAPSTINATGAISGASIRTFGGTASFAADDYGKVEITPTTGDGGSAVIRQYTNSPRSGGNLIIQVDGNAGGGNLIFSTNNAGAGTERVRIDSIGNVGIGTSSPNKKLAVNGNTNITGSLDVTGAISGASIQTSGFASLGGIATTGSANSWGLLVENKGNAYASVFVHAQSSLLTLFTNPQVAIFGNNYPAQSAGIYSGIFPLVLGVSNQEAMRISTSNNVGIGTSSPNARLHVSGGIAIFNSITTGDSNSGLRIVAPVSITHYNWMLGAQQNVSSAFEITPSTAQGGTTFSTPTAVFTATGNVGIGTTSPTSRLSIQNSGGSDSVISNYVMTNGSNAATFRTTDSPVTFGIHSQNGGNIYIKDTSDNVLFYGKDGGNVGIGTTSPNQKLAVNGNTNVTGSLDVTGAFTAQTKSFKINHQTVPGKSLVYGVLEGPEHGVYVRGRLTNNNTIILPAEWDWLIDPASITVQLTPIGSHQKLYVDDIVNNVIFIKNENLINKDINCFYIVHATRKDVDPLQTVQ